MEHQNRQQSHAQAHGMRTSHTPPGLSVLQREFRKEQPAVYLPLQEHQVRSAVRATTTAEPSQNCRTPPPPHDTTRSKLRIKVDSRQRQLRERYPELNKSVIEALYDGGFKSTREIANGAEEPRTADRLENCLRSTGLYTDKTANQNVTLSQEHRKVWVYLTHSSNVDITFRTKPFPISSYNRIPNMTRTPYEQGRRRSSILPSNMRMKKRGVLRSSTRNSRSSGGALGLSPTKTKATVNHMHIHPTIRTDPHIRASKTH